MLKRGPEFYLVPEPESDGERRRLEQYLVRKIRGKWLVRPEAFRPGPGDLVHLAAKLIGIAALVRLWERKTGKQCGCQQRRRKLNDWWWRLRRGNVPPNTDEIFSHSGGRPARR